MIPRMTTVGTLKNYRYDLNRSYNTFGKAMQTVTTRRNFNSYAEDPALAVRCFQIRRSYMKTESQLTVNDSLRHKYDVGWAALENVSLALYSKGDDTSVSSIIRSLSDSTGPGRLALGQSLCAKAEDIVQTMNGRYGENYVFSGADTLNPPFTWGPQVNPEYDSTAANPVPKYLSKDGTPTDDVSSAAQGVYYRGVAVDSNDPPDKEKLEYFMKDETKYLDVGLGHKEENDEAISSTMFDSALQGIYFLGGHGTTNNLPNNVVSLVNEMGQILQRCDPENGEFQPGDEARFNELVTAFEDSASTFRERWTEMDTQSGFLRDNSELLETTADSLLQQYTELEDADPAAAISEFIFAKYCYDAALKVGNSVLSQSLMDYMNF